MSTDHLKLRGSIDPADRLVYWIVEREAIRHRKEVLKAPFPWTDDPILRGNRFCCVRREDDRVTKWIAKHVRKPFATHEHLWFMLCVCRIFNHPDTIARLIGTNAWPDGADFTPARMAGAVHALSINAKVFTGAYLIPPARGTWLSKADGIAQATLGNLWRDRGHIGPNLMGSTIERAHDLIQSYPGWGPFLAYQAVVDMRFTSILKGARDRMSWAAAGPGTIRGLNRLNGRPYDAPTRQRYALDEMLTVKLLVGDRTDVAIDFSDVPNVLCEFDKWERLRLGQGTVRAKYVPGRGA